MLFLILLVDKYNFWYHDKFMNWFKFTVEDTYIDEILISISIISSRDPVWSRGRVIHLLREIIKEVSIQTHSI